MIYDSGRLSCPADTNLHSTLKKIFDWDGVVEPLLDSGIIIHISWLIRDKIVFLN